MDDTELARQVDAVSRTGRRRTTPRADGTMTWHLFGEGKPVVFMHGGMGSWMHWIRNIPTLSQSFAMLVPDIPGHMDSAMPQPYGPEAVGEVLVRGIDEILGPDATFDVVGFSFGTTIAGQVARLGASRVSRLLLTSPSGLGLPRGPTGPIQKWRHLEDVAERRAIHKSNLCAGMIHDPAHADDLAVYVHAISTERAQPVSAPISFGDSLRSCLPHVQARFGCIWGVQDPASAPYMDERRALMHGIQPDAPLLMIDGASHWVPYEQPDRFHQALFSILRP
jgi:pimeloyl-ACP methyl ester carboxylesterase